MKTFFRFVCCLAVIAVSIVLLACSHKGEIGQQVFHQQCGACHNADNSDRKMGPGLKGLFHKAKLASNGKKVTEANVRAKIDEGGNGMPAYKEMLSDEDKDNVIAYLETL